MFNLPYPALLSRFTRRPRLARAVGSLLVLAAAAWPSTTHAHRGKAGARRAARSAAARPATGKVALFPFQDDDDRSIGGQVERLLRARGFEVVTDVRPVDTAEQYRELASTLNLAALVGGSYQEGEKKARLKIQVRSGYTGRPLVAITFKESRFHLRAQLEDKLWTRIGPAMTRACADASRPRLRGRGPLVIDAGTSLASSGEIRVP
jgi:TolB-like protein